MGPGEGGEEKVVGSCSCFCLNDCVVFSLLSTPLCLAFATSLSSLHQFPNAIVHIAGHDKHTQLLQIQIRAKTNPEPRSPQIKCAGHAPPHAADEPRRDGRRRRPLRRQPQGRAPRRRLLRLRRGQLHRQEEGPPPRRLHRLPSRCRRVWVPRGAALVGRDGHHARWGDSQLRGLHVCASRPRRSAGRTQHYCQCRSSPFHVEREVAAGGRPGLRSLYCWVNGDHPPCSPGEDPKLGGADLALGNTTYLPLLCCFGSSCVVASYAILRSTVWADEYNGVRWYLLSYWIPDGNEHQGCGHCR